MTKNIKITLFLHIYEYKQNNNKKKEEKKIDTIKFQKQNKTTW